MYLHLAAVFAAVNATQFKVQIVLCGVLLAAFLWVFGTDCVIPALVASFLLHKRVTQYGPPSSGVQLGAVWAGMLAGWCCAVQQPGKKKKKSDKTRDTKHRWKIINQLAPPWFWSFNTDYNWVKCRWRFYLQHSLDWPKNWEVEITKEFIRQNQLRSGRRHLQALPNYSCSSYVPYSLR